MISLDEINQEEAVAIQQELKAVKKRLQKLEEEKERERGSSISTGNFERIAREHGMYSYNLRYIDIDSKD